LAAVVLHRWLGRREPDDLTNRFLIKYKLIIKDCGGWEFLRGFLAVLKVITNKHGVDIATIATAAALTFPNVAAAIVGT
jgi:aryl-alcohol dehydrogenase-like predicted oxidoreductase